MFQRRRVLTWVIIIACLGIGALYSPSTYVLESLKTDLQKSPGRQTDYVVLNRQLEAVQREIARDHRFTKHEFAQVMLRISSIRRNASHMEGPFSIKISRQCDFTREQLGYKIESQQKNPRAFYDYYQTRLPKAPPINWVHGLLFLGNLVLLYVYCVLLTLAGLLIKVYGYFGRSGCQQVLQRFRRELLASAVFGPFGLFSILAFEPLGWVEQMKLEEELAYQLRTAREAKANCPRVPAWVVTVVTRVTDRLPEGFQWALWAWSMLWPRHIRWYALPRYLFTQSGYRRVYLALMVLPLLTVIRAERGACETLRYVQTTYQSLAGKVTGINYLLCFTDRRFGSRDLFLAASPRGDQVGAVELTQYTGSYRVGSVTGVLGVFAGLLPGNGQTYGGAAASVGSPVARKGALSSFVSVTFNKGTTVCAPATTLTWPLSKNWRAGVGSFFLWSPPARSQLLIGPVIKRQWEQIGATLRIGKFLPGQGPSGTQIRLDAGYAF